MDTITGKEVIHRASLASPIYRVSRSSTGDPAMYLYNADGLFTLARVFEKPWRTMLIAIMHGAHKTNSILIRTVVGSALFSGVMTVQGFMFDSVDCEVYTLTNPQTLKSRGDGTEISITDFIAQLIPEKSVIISAEIAPTEI